jgi:nitroreductase
MPRFFSQPVMELTQARTSVRTYKEENLEPELRQKLADYMASAEGINGSPVRLLLLDRDIVPNGAKMGTYGMIKGARHYIAAMVKKGDNAALVELGFLLEKVVLFAGSLGLGTVWLGGTFNKGQFAKAAQLSENEILPIVMPVGYPAENRSLLERMMRKTTGAVNRMEWKELFFDGETLKMLSESDAGEYKDALEAVRLAPSAMNAQPWRVIRQENSFLFYKTSRHAQTGFDMHLVDMGIALCHFELAAREAGLEGNWTFEQEEQSPMPANYEFIAAWQSK